MVSGQAVHGTGNNSINNSMIKNLHGSPVSAAGPRLTSSQQYLSQMNANNSRLMSNNNPASEHQTLGKNNTGSASALGVKAIDREMTLGVHSKTMKTVRVQEGTGG